MKAKSTYWQSAILIFFTLQLVHECYLVAIW